MNHKKITPEMVKELRERTGVGMGKCKEALDEAKGDIELAIANLRKAGLASAVKKEGRETLYWLRLIVEMNPVFSNKLEFLSKENEEIIKIFQSLNKAGNTIILVTHDKDIADRAKKIIKIHDGQII